MNRADLTLWNCGDPRNHADEIAWLDGMGAADIERQTNHARFVGDGARFLTRAGAFWAFVFIAASLTARFGGGVGVAAVGAIRIMSRTKRAAVLGDCLRFTGFVLA